MVETAGAARLAKKVALVTGGGSGLGKAIARRLAAEGACVTITDLQRDLGQAAAREGGFRFLEQDVCDESRWTAVIREVEVQNGRLDILVNNAGIEGPMDTPEDTRLADWKKVFAINVEGVFLGCRAAIPAMRRSGGGSIINLSSAVAFMATPNHAAYGASKAAVRQLTKSVAQYCAQKKLNIRCNSVHPGGVSTPMLGRIFEDLAKSRGIAVEHLIEETKANLPSGDFIQPEDIAFAVLFLASDD